MRLWWAGMPVDLFFDHVPVHAAAARHAAPCRSPGRRSRCSGSIELAVFKVMYDRTRDWADIEAMLGAETLDLDAVRGTLRGMLDPADPASPGSRRRSAGRGVSGAAGTSPSGPDRLDSAPRDHHPTSARPVSTGPDGIPVAGARVADLLAAIGSDPGPPAASTAAALAVALAAALTRMAAEGMDDAPRVTARATVLERRGARLADYAALAYADARAALARRGDGRRARSATPPLEPRSTTRPPCRS